MGFLWRAWARPSQIPPDGNWTTWLLLAGRGFGKTTSGSQFLREEVESGRSCRAALVAPTAADARDIVVEGKSGVLSVFPPMHRPLYEPSKRRISFSNGAIATVYSAEEPDRLRGPEHDFAWSEELGSWRYPAAWDNLQLGLRLGAHPRQVVTTTPRPVRTIRDLMRDPHTIVTRGTTYENRMNLSESFYRQVISRYEGTRIGRQELMGELLIDVPGALWVRSMFDVNIPAPDLERIVVGVDPAASSGPDSDETGVLIAGRSANGHIFVLDDLSCRLRPEGWSRVAVMALHRYSADRVVAEKNNGGDMVGSVIHNVDPTCPVRLVSASRGKRVRAEPVSALYEQGLVHHVRPFPDLEDQLCTWTQTSKDSPDRMDALVWAVTELTEHGRPNFRWL